MLRFVLEKFKKIEMHFFFCHGLGVSKTTHYPPPTTPYAYPSPLEVNIQMTAMWCYIEY